MVSYQTPQNNHNYITLAITIENIVGLVDTLGDLDLIRISFTLKAGRRSKNNFNTCFEALHGIETANHFLVKWNVSFKTKNWSSSGKPSKVGQI